MERRLIRGSPAENCLGRLDLRLEPLERRKQALTETPADTDLVAWWTHALHT